MIRRLAIVAAAVLVLGALAVGGLVAYAATLSGERVINDAAGRICRSILMNRSDLPATPEPGPVHGLWSETSQDRALRSLEDLKASAPDLYHTRVELTKQLYSRNRAAYVTAVALQYGLAGSPAGAPGQIAVCQFVVTPDLSGHAIGKLESVFFDSGFVSMRDPNWQSLLAVPGLSPAGYVEPTLWLRIMALVSPVYAVWRKAD